MGHCVDKGSACSQLWCSSHIAPSWPVPSRDFARMFRRPYHLLQCASLRFTSSGATSRQQLECLLLLLSWCQAAAKEMQSATGVSMQIPTYNTFCSPKQMLCRASWQSDRDCKKCWRRLAIWRLWSGRSSRRSCNTVTSSITESRRVLRQAMAWQHWNKGSSQTDYWVEAWLSPERGDVPLTAKQRWVNQADSMTNNKNCSPP